MTDFEATIENCFRLYRDRVVLQNLTSEAGLRLNGKVGTVEGMDGLIVDPVDDSAKGLVPGTDPATFRIHVLLDCNREQLMRVRPANLRVLGPSFPYNPSRLSNDDILKELDWLTNTCRETKRGMNFGERFDCTARQKLVYKWSGQKKVPNPEEIPRCCDTTVGGVVNPYANGILRELTRRAPICAGTGFIDFSLFGSGLFAEGDTDCTVCLLRMERGSPVALLPCGHQLHPDCAKSMETHRANDPRQPKVLVSGGDVVEACSLACPVCRKLVTGTARDNMAHHSTPSAFRLRMRFLHYIRLGMCAHCQLKFIEQSQFTEQVIMTDQGPVTSFIANHVRAPHVQVKT